MNIIKRNIKKFMGSAICSDFCSPLFKFMNRKKLLILYYHRVVTTEELADAKGQDMCVHVDSFENQMKFLSEHYHTISEQEIISTLGDWKIPENSIWVTFDDGYKDNYLHAYPILKKYNIPATFFITTGFINKQVIPCEDYIAKAIRMLTGNIKLILNNSDYTFNLDTEQSKDVAIKTLWGILEKRNIHRNNFLEQLIRSIKITKEDIPDLFMNWDEIKEMCDNGFCIGGHTITHKILSALSTQEITKEISESKSEIERRLGKNIFSFAYPNGRKADYNLDTCAPILKSCGIKLSVTTLGGYNNLNYHCDLFNLKRMGVTYEDTMDCFNFKVSTGSFWQ